MKKTIIGLLLLSSVSVSANSSCIESIRLARAANQQYVDQVQGSGQPVYQQQQQSGQNEKPPEVSIVDGFKIAYYLTGILWNEFNAESKAKSNVKYYQALEKIEAGTYSKKDARTVLGSDYKNDIIEFKKSGNSVCVNSDELIDRIEDIEAARDAYIEYENEMGIKENGELRKTVSYHLDVSNLKMNVFKFPMKVMGHNAMYFTNTENFEVNALKVRTKSQLRRAVR